jgi:hypothetical protein
MTKEIVHSLILILTIVLAFVFPKTSLSDYEIQITAGLFIMLYLTRKFVSSQNIYSRLIESVVFTLIIVAIVNTTGGINSNFFFLIYFLLFSISLLLEPVVSITATVALIVFFLLSLPQGQDLKNLLPIISLAFITPFAMFLGQEHIQSEKLKVKNKKLEEDSLLFVSLLIKNHLKTIKEAVENFVGDHQLDVIKKSANRMEKLIEKFEKQS